MENRSISVIVPAYNEEAVIRATVLDILSYLKRKFGKYEIIVISDGSTDSTVEQVSKIKAVRVISNKFNKGKGYSVKRGMMMSNGDLVLFMDADNSTNITELGHFLRELDEADIIIGSRALKDSNVVVGQNQLKQTLGRLGNSLIKLVLDLQLKDTRCGFKLFKRKTIHLFEKLRLDRWGFDDEVLFLAKKAGYIISESPVTWVNNFESKVRFTDYIISLFELLNIRIRYQLKKY